ncbi:related to TRANSCRIPTIONAL REPRESSOR RCO-1 [Phialocephala subalpina]|uniref:Related to TRANSCRIPTIONAL REPRESSOR RCO-1 n=1 Tax=Phialocephala subalpina TaxID=576137 RepID=A0A1L7WMC1_9HELO|nr:related to TRANSCRIPTIONAL REPRESSOR RCO-1 [Phialocephala subalpina]
MSRSTDPGHFFQTDASESTRARRAAKSGNKNGNPIVLQSKILSVIPDPFSPACVYVAESAGCVRKVNIETRDSKIVYRGPTAPVTSVAVGGQGGSTIFAGCWDKNIWSWDRETRTLGRTLKGHSDFVKVVISARLQGTDASLPMSFSCERLHTLRDKSDTMMAVQNLALDPVDSTDSELVLVSSSSDPHIRRWRISLSSATQIYDSTQDAPTQNKPTRDTILEHETSVYHISFFGDEDDVDLWTASADGTAKCLSRARNWSTEDSYQHGDYVRAVAVTDDWVITAGRDEDVKVWDRATGKLWHVYEGHYEEVTGLVILGGEKKAISVSIDGTIRTWGLGKADLEKVRKEREELSKGVVKEEKVPEKKNLLTAEEESELAELMDSDDE